MAVALLALFFAMGSSAVAAHHYLITSTKQIKPSVLKQLKGAKGPRGAQGAKGDQGSVGAQGAKGDQGPAGPLVTVEAWHEVGATGEPVFGTSWSNQSPGSAATAAFYEDPFGIVHLKGWVTNYGAPYQPVIFTLPVNYRPTKSMCFPSVDETQSPPRIVPVCVGATGNVYEPYSSYSGAIMAKFDGITFRAGTG